MQSFNPSPKVERELEMLIKTMYHKSFIDLVDKSKLEDLLNPIIFSYHHLGLWCAVRHGVICGEQTIRGRFNHHQRDRKRIRRAKKMIRALLEHLKESMLGRVDGNAGFVLDDDESANANPQNEGNVDGMELNGEETGCRDDGSIDGNDGNDGSGSDHHDSDGHSGGDRNEPRRSDGDGRSRGGTKRKLDAEFLANEG
ncbi:unnamed protein product, partial [Choristocarpus tenellus]